MGEEKDERDPWRPPPPSAGEVPDKPAAGSPWAQPPPAQQPPTQQPPTQQPGPGWPSGPHDPYAQPQGGQLYGPPPVRSTNGLAIAALVLGILAPFTCITGILAVIFGHIALGQINRTAQEGKGIAIAGLITGYGGIALWTLLIVVGVTADLDESALPVSMG